MELNKLQQGLSYSEYAAEPGLRSSDLKAMMRSPAHYVEIKKAPRKETEALHFGGLFHTAIERPEWFRQNLVVEPEFVGVTKDGRPTKSKNASDVQNQKKQWLGELTPGSIVVTEEEQTHLLGMLESVLNHKLVGNLIRDGVREASVWVDDPQTGLRMKARYDFVSAHGYPVDFKTTLDARPGSFLRDIFSSRGENPRFYSLQAAHYAYCARLAKACSGESFTFVAVEKVPPYGIQIYPMDHACLEVGEQSRKRLAHKYAHCLRLNKWPCYDEAATPVQIPQWAIWEGDFE